MRNRFNRLITSPVLFFSGFVLFTLVAFLWERNFQGRGPGRFSAESFQKVLYQKLDRMEETMEFTRENILKRGLDHWLSRDNGLRDLENRLEKNEFALMVFRNDSLLYWSDNTIPVDSLLVQPGTGFTYLGNAWYVTVKWDSDQTGILGLMKIKNNYPYQNQFLRNRFRKDLSTPAWVEIAGSQEKTNNNFPVYDRKGQFLFSLSVKFYSFLSKTRLHPPLVFYLLGLFFALAGLRMFFRRIRNPWLYLGYLGLLSLVFVLARYLQLQFRLPLILYNHEIFSPGLFAWSRLLPSLGDLLLHALFFLFIAYLLFVRRHTLVNTGTGKTVLYVYLGSGLFILGLLSQYFYDIFRNLILNSSISFEIQRLLDITSYSFIALAGIAMLIVAIILLIDFMVCSVRKKAGAIPLLAATVASFLAGYLLMESLASSNLPNLVFWLLVSSFLVFIRYYKDYVFRYSTYLVFTLLVAVFSVYAVSLNSFEKEKNVRKVLAVNMAAEHDAVAELLLDETTRILREDDVLEKMMEKEFFTDKEVDGLFQYLLKNYFSGFWEQYYLEITICNPRSTLEVTGTDTLENCYHFFSETLRDIGELITDTCFYYLNNHNGRISYFGEFIFPGQGMENRLYIRLDSKLVYEQTGYPELLLDEEFARTRIADRYSYAKYHRGQLIAQTGIFPYSLDLTIYPPVEEEFQFVHFSSYDHLFYKTDDASTIILSQSRMSLIDLLVLFAYLFVYYFILMNIFLVFSGFPGRRGGWQLNFKNKIQLSMVGILFLALIMIGGGAVYYSIKQYGRKHDENIREKIQSVYIELDHKLAFEDKLTPDWRAEGYLNLNELLLKFSNVFYTDINLYDLEGRLLATSRIELYDQKLTGKLINHKAFRELSLNRKAEFVQRENIGKMEYLSAYVPYINTNNKTLAYLNLPYFTRQDLLTSEVSTLVVAIVNISFLLILLTIFLAVVISNRITNPLRIIQSEFSRIKLGRRGEKITYQGKDEIGELVSEYNRMVTELERSMELLARSERESAWREMAKQVAHEIKNPLTPMKLTVQQIKRLFDDKAPGWEENFKSFSQTLIEQIDHLSSIATAFSNFAQMPRVQYEEVDLVERVKNAVALFSNTGNIVFKIEGETENPITVLADREQVIGIFTNLIKNAIQSIPETREGLIRIELGKNDRFAVVAVHDNGKGISGEMGDRLFVPNFTTKSSGMGLGLAIVKSVVENTGGRVYYKTREEEGSSFFVELPLYRKG